ncbi:MAG: hypothetical protein ACLQBQ_05805 [Smithella sp.]
MKHFVKNIVLFLCYCLLMSVCLGGFYFYYYKFTLNDIPAPNLSHSYAFNEKMQFLRNCPKDADIISIGSSMSLHNLHSKTITERLHSDKYLNVSSWGMSMEDNFFLLITLCKIYSPNTLIIASNVVDFTSLGEKDIKYSFLENYLRSHYYVAILYQLLNFNLNYYTSNLRFAKLVRNSPNDYIYLGFDKYGGGNFNTTDFNFDLERWNTGWPSGDIDTNQYSYLDKILTFCKSNKIKLLFFQSPIRNGLYSHFDNNRRNILKSHINTIENIMKRDKHIFINSNNVVWKDYLFVDGVHLSPYGAKLFTEYCFDKIKEGDKVSP